MGFLDVGKSFSNRFSPQQNSQESPLKIHSKNDKKMNYSKSSKQKMEHTTNSENKIKEYKSKINVWFGLSIILGIIAILLLFIIFSRGVSGISGNAISEKEAGLELAKFLNKQTNGGVEFVSSIDKGYLYEVKVKYQAQEMPVYITKDGKYFVQGATPLTDEPVMENNVANSNNVQNSQKNVQKSDKPIVEAFIFSYCPYGLQFEKALFPVYDLLKNKADFRIVAIGAMHGEFERIESLRQISIEELYGKDKLFSYLKEFDLNNDIGSCSGDDSCLNNYLPGLYKKLDIDKSKVENYMKTNAPKIYDEQNARANELGVSGSPTFVINGVQVQVNRAPDAIRQAVCNAFNSLPEECSKTLSTQSANAGFG